MTIKLTNDPAAAGVRFAVKVVPGSSRDRIVGALGEALKIAVRKPPEGGAANRAVLKILADRLGIAESAFSITRGHANPRKEVLVTGISTQELASRLASIR